MFVLNHIAFALCHVLLINVRLLRSDKGSPECFSTIWNVPSGSCTKTLGYEIPFDNYGVKSNKHQNFYGETINIFYSSRSLWPYLRKGPGGAVQEFNGGIPQRGDLPSHLDAFEAEVKKFIPNPNYEGLAMIDFEEYIPDLNILQGKLRSAYQERSLAYAKELDPSITTDKKLRSLATNLFNNATRLFMEETLKRAISLRPKGKWGFYGYPYCYRAELDRNECVVNQKKLNDANMWLYQTSTALYPSIYLYKQNLPGDLDTGVWMRKIMAETRRIQKNLPKSVPVYPYIRFEYPTDATYKTERFLKKADIVMTYRLAVDYGMDGLVIWGSSEKIGPKCALLDPFLRNYIKPAIQDANRFCRICKSRLCDKDTQNGKKTKCIRRDPLNPDYISNIFGQAENGTNFPIDYKTMHRDYVCETS